MSNVLTHKMIEALKAEGKYRYVRFVDGQLQGSNTPQHPNVRKEGKWDDIELEADEGSSSMKLFSGQVIDLTEI